ncbi:MAG: RidA family protein [Xanthomonadaceae bacterium]|jgi:enamine deaminase RidA (YjgF/YER057c/UK114 family)|nr:RidA family protein [Xanthomonadaceae bacterium]
MFQRIDIGPRMSEATIYNGVVYLSGQIADDPSAGIKGQVEQTLASIDELLGRAGSDKSKILRAEVFLVDLNDFAAMNEVWERWVTPGQTPARVTVQAKLAHPDWKVEIVVTAAV